MGFDTGKRSRRSNGKLELAEKIVVLGERSLTSAGLSQNGHSLAEEIYVEFIKLGTGERL